MIVLYLFLVPFRCGILATPVSRSPSLHDEFLHNRNRASHGALCRVIALSDRSLTQFTFYLDAVSQIQLHKAPAPHPELFQLLVSHPGAAR